MPPSHSKTEKKTYNTTEILDFVLDLHSNYIDTDMFGSEYILPYNEHKSKIPFDKLINMIKNCNDLEKPYTDEDGTILALYVFPEFYTKLKDDFKLLEKGSIKEQKDDIDKYKILYIKVLIEIIRVYLNPNKHPNDTFYRPNDTFYRIIDYICKDKRTVCENKSIVDNIMDLLKNTADPLLNKKSFITLCNKIIPTEGNYTGLPHGIPIDNTTTRKRYLISASLPAVIKKTRKKTPKISVSAEEEPDHIDRNGNSVYLNRISWNPDVINLLHKRPRSRGGKRKTKRTMVTKIIR